MFESEIVALEKQSKLAEKKRSSERATDNFVIQPFIKALGYDTSNPEEVEPEFYADRGIKKGEKVDYALMVNNEPEIIIEIKAIIKSLNASHDSQLFRYFAPTDVKIAILTNGKEAWFYSDLNKKNVMDEVPFFKFDFQNNTLKERTFLEHFHRNNFQINKIIKAARMLKDLQKVKAYIQNNVVNPDDEFARFIGKEINGGIPRKDMIEPLKASIKSAFNEITDKKITEYAEQTHNNSFSRTPETKQKNEHTAFTNFTHEKAQAIHTMPSSIQGTRLEKYYHPNYRRFIHQEPVKSLFEKYIMEMQELGDEKINQVHVAYCTRSNHTFSAIQEYAQGIKIWLNIEEINEINDPRNICTAIGFNRFGARKHHTGIGQVFILVTRDSDHDYIMGLVKQVYEQKA